MIKIDINSEIYNTAIAIVGMTGKFPGANNIEEFWHNLENGVESIIQLTDEEIIASGVNPELLQNPHYVKLKGILPDIDLFDANFFGYSGREAELIDPQQRLFLESSWTALESAGYNPETYQGLIGVYAGVGANQYLLNNIYQNQQTLDTVDHYQISISSDKDFLPTRVAYKLNLTGPAVNVQTACSTSLVSVHLACQGLLNGECDLALAGGVSFTVPHKAGYLYQEGMVLSPDGHCRAFDDSAQGTAAGSGVGIVVLKRLRDAIADRDQIHAIIRGSAINNDGAVKVGYTAPSVDGQAAVIAEAQAIAGIDNAEVISYIEAHGTGTPLGDPIEIAALTQAFHQTTDKKGFCAIGSVKTNIGHLDTAAGVTGLIKTVLALQNRLIPPSLNFQTPNSKIDFANSPFYVNSTLKEWRTDGIPRYAGVSSFGIGGTNAHVVLEETPEELKIANLSFNNQSKQYILCLSAKTETALEQTTSNLINYLQQHPAVNLGDVAYTLGVGRKAFNHRRVVVCQNVEDAVKALSSLESKQVVTNYTENINRPVVFMFPGQGSQYVNMAQEIYATEPVFTQELDLCAEILQPLLGLDIREVIYPSPENIEEATKQLQQTALSQPAIFIIEYALAKLWQSWGVQPTAFIGHSIGEYVAACLAGVLSLEDALTLVTARGKLMQQLPSGSMLSVPLSPEQLKTFLNPEIAIAAINNPSQSVVSGTTTAIETLKNQLASGGIESRYLHTSHAFHSPMMEPILAEFTAQVKKINLNTPNIPYISNLTGTWITPHQATNPEYYSQHLRSTVLFAEGVEKLLNKPEQILLEVGAGRTLTTLTQKHPAKSQDQIILNSLPHPQEQKSSLEVLFTTLSQMWTLGCRIDWSDFYAENQYFRINLPTYPFERQRYWIEPTGKNINQSINITSNKKNISDWFYIPSWQRKPITNNQINQTTDSILVFVDDSQFSISLVNRLEKTYKKVVLVKPGDRFKQENHNLYIINPQQPQDYDLLLSKLGESLPPTIVYLWHLQVEEIDTVLDIGFYSLLLLAQAFGKHNLTEERQIIVLSQQMQDVTGTENIHPEQAVVIGAVKTIPQEYPQLNCRCIDIVLPASATTAERQILEQLVTELQVKSSDQIIAYRHQHRWIQTFTPVQLEKSNQNIHRLKEGGVYLITGGLGGISFKIAEYLAQEVKAKLILLGRASIPARQQWEEWLNNHDVEDSISQKIRQVQELEKLGAEVLIVSADVTNLQQMQVAIAQSQNHFGTIDGVIHAAGVPGGGLIQQKTKQQAQSIISAKIQGTLILDNIFQHHQLDFLVLFSSLSSIIPAVGQVDYCTANAFLDAFAAYKNSQNSTFTVAINWDAWQQIGMAATAAKKSADKLDYSYLEQALLPTEGIEVFSRVLQNQINQILVSTTDLPARLHQNNQLVKIESSTTAKYARPQLSKTYIAPRNWLEQKVAEIWQETLGIQEIGINDDFLDLGGDSLIATQIVSSMRKEFPDYPFSVASLFASPTIAAIATQIENSSTLVTANTDEREEIEI